MKLIKFNCPQCGEIMEIDTEKGYDVCYCSYCGEKMLIDDGSLKIVRIDRDEAKILEIISNEKIKMKQLEMENKKYEDRKKYRSIWIIITLVLVALMLLSDFIYDMTSIEAFSSLNFYSAALAFIIGSVGFCSLTETGLKIMRTFKQNMEKNEEYMHSGGYTEQMREQRMMIEAMNNRNSFFKKKNK